MITPKHPLLAVVFLLAALCAGCAGAEAVDGALGAGPGCPLPELTEACSAECGAGRRVCMAAGWGPCECETLAGGAGQGGGVNGDVVTQGALRTDITFDWDETVPGQGGGEGGSEYCVPGTYAGEYMMNFEVAALGGAPVPAEGPAVITFDQAQKGEFLATADGSTLEVNYLDQTIHALMPLEGGVHCGTGRFEATATECTFEVLGLPAGNCTADLEGQFDPATQTITGTFVSDSGALGGGMGVFTITRVP